LGSMTMMRERRIGALSAGAAGIPGAGAIRAREQHASDEQDAKSEK